MNPPYLRELIKKWVIGWENLHDDIIDVDIESERDITLDFLKTGYAWVPNFYINWAL